MKKILLFILVLTGITLAQPSASYLFKRDTSWVATHAWSLNNFYTKLQADILYNNKADTVLSNIVNKAVARANLGVYSTTAIDTYLGAKLDTTLATSALRTGWSLAKTRTDLMVQDTTNWNTAYTNNHTHTNKSKLDSLINSASVLNSLTSSVISNSHTNNSNRAKLDSLTASASILNGTNASFTTTLKNTYDAYATTKRDTTYLSGITSNVQVQLNGKQASLGFTPVTNARTIKIFNTTKDLTANQVWTITKDSIGLGNVTNESKATMFTNSTFTGNTVATNLALGTSNIGTNKLVVNGTSYFLNNLLLNTGNGTYAEGLSISYNAGNRWTLTHGADNGFYLGYGTTIGTEVTKLSITSTGAVSATSLALGGATIGTNALAITGAVSINATGGELRSGPTSSYNFPVGIFPIATNSGLAIGIKRRDSATTDAFILQIGTTNYPAYTYLTGVNNGLILNFAQGVWIGSDGNTADKNLYAGKISVGGGDITSNALAVTGTVSISSTLDVRGELYLPKSTYSVRFYNTDRNNWSYIRSDVGASSTLADLEIGDGGGKAIYLDGSTNVQMPGKLFVGYTSDPTSGNKFAVNGNEYINGNSSIIGQVTAQYGVFQPTSGGGLVRIHATAGDVAELKFMDGANYKWGWYKLGNNNFALWNQDLTKDVLSFSNTTGAATFAGELSVNGSILYLRGDGDLDLEFTKLNNTKRWRFVMAGTESGSNAGSDYKIFTYNDAGTYLGNPLTISRATGDATFANNITTNGTAIINGSNAGGYGILFFNTDTVARDCYINNQGNSSLNFSTNNNVRLTISNTGNATFAGQVLVTATSAATPNIAKADDPDTGFFFRSGGARAGIAINGVLNFEVESGNVAIGNNSAANLMFGQDGNLNLTRGAANVLEQRNGTSAQTYNLYNTYTDATHFERLAIKFDSNNILIRAEGGTEGGTSRDILIGSKQVVYIQTGTSYSTRWYWDANGHYIPNVTNTYDVGSSSYTIRSAYIGTSVNLGTATGGYHLLASGSASTSNLNAFNFVQTAINKTRTSAATARDTSAISGWFSSLGSPTFSIKGKGGENLLSVDSLGITSDRFAYGSVYIDDSYPDSIDVTSSAKYYTVGAKQGARGKAWTSGGILKNVTVQDSSMTVSIAGKYEVSYSFSFQTITGVTNGTFNFYLFVNDVKQEKTGAKRLMSGTNDLGVGAVAPTVLSLNANDVLKLKVISPSDASNTVAFQYAIMHVKRIDN